MRILSSLIRVSRVTWNIWPLTRNSSYNHVKNKKHAELKTYFNVRLLKNEKKENDE